MEQKERFEDQVIKAATQILVADINNGSRSYWIDELGNNKIDKLISQSVNIAEKLVRKVLKNDVE